MSKIDLDPITSGYNLSKINANFQKVEDELNNKVLYRNPPTGEPNSMSSNLDMNSRSILNASKISGSILELGGVQVVPTSLAVDPYNGTREALRRSYAEVGCNLVDGSCEVGATLTAENSVVLYESNGRAYSHAGPYPYDVVPNTNPTAGGGFVDRSGQLVHFSSIEDMLAASALVNGAKVHTGVTHWLITSSNAGWPLDNGTQYALPLNGVWIQDSTFFDGNGTTGMSALLQQFIDTPSRTSIMLGDNTIRIDATVKYKGGTRIRGAGRRGDYKYASSGDVGGTLLIVDDGVSAFVVDAPWAHYPEISGLTFRANTHGSSAYGNPATFSANTKAIDVLYTVEGVFENLAFESIDQCLYNRQGTGQQALRPCIRGIVAQDCNYLFRFIDGAADVHISDVPISLHCNYHLFCDAVDGIHISDVRFFQSYNTSVTFKNSQFVNGSNIVCFETANTQFVIDNCDNVNISALTLSRAGWYHAGTPFPAKTSLNVVNSRNVKLQGIIERPSGKAANIDSANGLSIDMDVKAPYNTNGGPSAVTIYNSIGVSIAGNYTIRGNADNTVEVDQASRYGVTYNVCGDAFCKGLRYISTNADVFSGTIPIGTVVANLGTSPAVVTKKIKVPAGKKLVLVGIFYDSTNGLRPRIGSNFFLAMPSTDEGKEDYSQHVLFDNTAGAVVVDYSLVVQLYNNSGSTVTTGSDTVVCYTKFFQN